MSLKIPKVQKHVPGKHSKGRIGRKKSTEKFTYGGRKIKKDE